MSDSNMGLPNLVSSASVITLSSIFKRGLAFGARIAIISSLSPNLFGGIALAFTIGLSVSEVFVFGLPKGIARMCGSQPRLDRKLDFVRAGIFMIGLIAVPISILVLLFRQHLAVFFDEPALVTLLFYFAAYIFLKMFEKGIISALRGLEEPRATAIVRDIVPEIVSISVLSVFIFAGRPYEGALSYFLSLPMATVLSGTVAIFLSTNSTSLVGTPKREQMVELARFSWPLAFDGALLLLMGSLDVLLLGILTETSNVGVYRASQTISQLIIVILFAFGFVYLPYATRLYSDKKYNRLEQTFKQTTKWIVLVTLPAAIGLIVFSEDILKIAYGSDYVVGSTTLQILVIGMFTRVLAGLDSVMIKAINRTKLDLLSTASGLLINTVFNLILIPIYGLEGAALGTIAGFFVYNVIELGIIYKLVGIHPYSFHMFKPFIFVLFTGTVLYYLPIGTSLVFLFLGGIVLVLVTALAVLLTGSIDKSDYEAVSELL